MIFSAVSRTLCLFCLLLTSRGMASPNLLRNGSFEGGSLYWHRPQAPDQEIVQGGKDSPQALRLTKGPIMSAPWVAERGQEFTVSLWAKSTGAESLLEVQMPPSSREDGTRAKRLWSKEAGQSAKVSPEWQRLSFTWKADVPSHPFWPLPHYMIQLEKRGGAPILIDGVTVTPGTTGTPDYVPRREVEIGVACPDLPGYEVNGNLFAPEAKPRLQAHVSNPTTQPRAIIVRHQLYDYEGRTPLGTAVEKALTLAPHQTHTEAATLPLVAKGCVMARATVLDSSGQEIDRSEMPWTSLPYPKAATKPDPRERFGGSFAGGLGMISRLQAIGMRWIRWRPHSNGHDHLPEKPADLTRPETWKWTWFDHELDEQEAHGFSSHLVLYEPPHWILEKGNPLPLDMRWPTDDPRWMDLSVKTVWDHFVEAAVKHYAHRSVVFEIENEPEFDRWEENKLHEEYTLFTRRTARLIKQTLPTAKVMINNVYAIPNGLNGLLFSKKDGLKDIDIISWHDYRCGELAEAASIRRARLALDNAGGKHVKIWFNEGWGYTNTAVDEPIACSGLTSAQSTNAQISSVVEVTSAGQEKTVMFHLGYEKHGMSFWDYSGPGTMIWDWYDYPTPLVAAWNVLAHHISLSEPMGIVRPPGVTLATFQDLRNDRGVIIAWADGNAKADVSLKLPLTSMTVEDIMGNTQKVMSQTITLRQSGSPVILYDRNRSSGKDLAAAIAPLDRKFASFVSKDSAGKKRWALPAAWDGTIVGSSQGSVATHQQKPIWQLEQLWPDDWKQPANYRPMTWSGTSWHVTEGALGGQPTLSMKESVLEFATRAPHGNPAARRTGALTFIPDAAGVYHLRGRVSSRQWEGKSATQLLILRRSSTKVDRLHKVNISHGGSASLDGLEVTVSKGDLISLLPLIDGAFAGGTLKLKEASIHEGPAPAGMAETAQGYTIPSAWVGEEVGSARGNPALVGGQALWRVDHLLAPDPILTTNYRPLVWNGKAWNPTGTSATTVPALTVSDQGLEWTVGGSAPAPHTAALCFIAHVRGIWRVTATGQAKPLKGQAKQYRLGLYKKDAQRAALLATVDFQADGTPNRIEQSVELAPGHELMLLPLPDQDTAEPFNLHMKDLRVQKVDE